MSSRLRGNELSHSSSIRFQKNKKREQHHGKTKFITPKSVRSEATARYVNVCHDGLGGEFKSPSIIRSRTSRTPQPHSARLSLFTSLSHRFSRTRIRTLTRSMGRECEWTLKKNTPLITVLVCVLSLHLPTSSLCIPTPPT